MAHLGSNHSKAGLVRSFFAVVWSAPLLFGCAFYDEAVLPSLTGEFASSAPAAARPNGAPLGMGQLRPAAGEGVTAEPLQPLAVIRFIKPDLDFEDELGGAVQRALAGKPDVGFGLVAVSPSGKGATLDAVTVQRNIERVLAAMTKAGVAEDRVIFSAASDSDATLDEVRIYLLDLSKAP